MKPPSVCPVCYEDVPPKAKACPNCGADERSGWKENALIYDDLDLPDEAWDPGDENDELGRRSGTSHTGKAWPIVALVCLLAFIFWYFLGRWI